MPVGNEVVDCLPLLDKLYVCMSPGPQFSNYYRNNEFDDCAQHMKNMTICAKAKVKSDPKEALKIMGGCELNKDMRELKNSTTNGIVWDLKKKGSW